jgi:EAL domain-containing protein (putative c-di-GMP-specific phosphodiesterase class I)
MLCKIDAPFNLDEQAVHISASAGIAIAPADGSVADELIANADLALYRAKSDGGRGCCSYLPTLRAQAEARRKLDSELRRAYSESLFELYYQPQVRMADGAIVGAEALLRWRHPERGILAPGLFLEALAVGPIAHEVGCWILRRACEQAAAWHGMALAPVRIGVNLFPAQFHGGTLVRTVDDALAATGLPPEALELEITENIALTHDDAMVAPLRVLRGKGVGLAFDDFGTGYASLSYLTRYPISRVKIDQSFVRKIAEDADDATIVRSLIGLAHSLGLEVTAEGVETSAQASFLRSEGCDEAQGYLFAKPVPATEFERLLRAGQLIETQLRIA